MKNCLFLLLLLVFANHGFSMEGFKELDVVYKNGFGDNEIAAILWEKIQKNITLIDLDTKNVEALIVNPKRDLFILGSFYNTDDLEKALSLVDFQQKSIRVMLKEGDSKYEKLKDKYSLPIITFDATKNSYLCPTWNLLSKEKPTNGLVLLDQSYTINSLGDAPFVREFYVTESGGSLEQKKKIVYLIIDADEDQLKSIIKRGEAYLAKVESLDNLAIRNARSFSINETQIVFVNATFGWDRLTTKLFQTEFDGKRPNMIIFNKFYSFDEGKLNQYGLRSNKTHIDVGAIARHFGGPAGGWQKGNYSEGGFLSDMDIRALKLHLEKNVFNKQFEIPATIH